MGRRLCGIRRGDTEFQIKVLLMGGYVRLKGEQPAQEDAFDPRAYLAKARWKRMLISGAGPFGNLLLAFALFVLAYMLGYERPPNQISTAEIAHVLPDSAAAEVGIHEGDRIVRINGLTNPSWDQIHLLEAHSKSDPMHVVLERAGQTLGISVMPPPDFQEHIGRIGWEEDSQLQVRGILADKPAARAGLQPGDILLAINEQSIRSFQTLGTIIRESKGAPLRFEYKREQNVLRSTIQPVLERSGPDSIWIVGIQPGYTCIPAHLSLPELGRHSLSAMQDGPKLVVEMIARSTLDFKGSVSNSPVQHGHDGHGGLPLRGGVPILELWAMVTSLLGFLNLMPVPDLDGGALLVLLLESLTGRELGLRGKERLMQASFLLFITLLAWLVYSEVRDVEKHPELWNSVVAKQSDRSQQDTLSADLHNPSDSLFMILSQLLAAANPTEYPHTVSRLSESAVLSKSGSALKSAIAPKASAALHATVLSLSCT